MFELLLISIAVVGSFAAGTWDLKTSNVPDKVCIAMIALGLFLHILNGFLTNDFTILTNSLLFGGLFLGFGLLMYYTGQWGGGDGELLVAIGILLPTSSLVKTFFPFSFSFFINSIFIGAFYSILYSFVLVYRNRKIGKNFYNRLKNRTTVFITSCFIIFSALFLSASQILLFFISVLTFLLFLFQKFARTIEESFYRRIPVRKLKVDDMIGEDIAKLKIYKKAIRGLTKKEVRKIKKIRKYVIIKEGIRYGIVFPLALLFTLLFGDFLFFFL